MKTKLELPADALISCFNDSVKDCVKVIDNHGTILSFSENGYKMMEIDNPADVLGEEWLSFWKGEVAGKARAALEAAITGKLGYFEGYCPTFKGTPKWWEVTIVPLKNERGDTDWLLALSRDVTDAHNLRKENAELKKQLAAQS